MILPKGCKLQVVLAGAVAANELAVLTSWVDKAASVAEQPGAYDALTSGATAVDVVPVCPENTVRQVQEVMVCNLDTATATVSIRYYDAAGTTRVLTKTSIATGETLVYGHGQGFMVLGTTGNIRTGVASLGTKSIDTNLWWLDRHDIATPTAMASGVSQVLYIGKCPFAATVVKVNQQVLTAAVAVITWAEVAIFKGTPVIGSVPTDLLLMGYADVSATYNSTGIKRTTVTLTRALIAGDDVWVGVGSVAAVTMAQVLGGLADSSQMGLWGTVAVRPSLIGGAATVTIGGAAAIPAQACVQYVA